VLLPHDENDIQHDPGDFSAPRSRPLAKAAADPHDANPVEAEHVMNQMRQNYPEKALGWMKKARWIGPVEVPQDRVDYDDVGSWAASHEPDRVKHFAKQIKKGKGHTHPVVAVQEPGENKVKVIDGHHRTLAYHTLGKPVRAYIGFVDNDGGPWDETHVYQQHQGASSQNKFLGKVGPKGYIHGWIKVGAEVDASHLSLKKDGSVVHKESGTVVGHIQRTPDSPKPGTTTFLVHHADGTQTYHGVYKREALGTLATHHNMSVKAHGEIKSVEPEVKPAEVEKPVEATHEPETPKVEELKRPERETGTLTEPAPLERTHAVVSGETAELSGGFEDHLSPEDHARIKALIGDKKLKFADDKQAGELDTLKSRYLHSVLTKAGVPEPAAGLISSDTDLQNEGNWKAKDWAGVDRLVSVWGASGNDDIVPIFNKVHDMKEPPKIQPGDFDGAKLTEISEFKYAKSDFQSFSGPMGLLGFRFNDMSPEARQRREDFHDYWTVKAQQHYTQQVLKEAKISGDLPVIRAVYGKQAKQLQLAEHPLKFGAEKEPWTATTNSISSWSEPRGKASIRSLMNKSVGHEVDNMNIGAPYGVKYTKNDVPVAWMNTTHPSDQVFMHWRGEGELRNSVVALGEVVAIKAQPSSDNTTIQFGLKA
jgi:hypothetical protein